MRAMQGDLITLALEGRFDVIVHGCNCYHTMSAGIARTIAQKFPQASESDKETAYGAREKLGSFSTATVDVEPHRFIVVNAYTQHHYSGKGPLAEYDAIARCFKAIAKRFDGQRIGYPLIGAGLAGGDWQKIAPLIDRALREQDHTLVVLPGSNIPRSGT